MHPLTPPPRNLKIFPETGAELIFALAKHNIYSGDFTNGVYSYPQRLVVPTTLAAFQHVTDKDWQKATPLIIAVNSDISMAAIMEKKIALASNEADKSKMESEKNKLESQIVRAEKVAIPLAIHKHDRPVLVMFYDEETPTHFTLR